jgi:diguanylate cyclase (GGDEF)-like protein
MLRVFNCLTQQHDYHYVLFAALVCIAGAWVTLQLYAKAQQAAANQKLSWVFLTAVAAGSTIWTTHFIAMLGFDPLIPHGYEPFLTLLSWLAAVAGSFIAFLIAIAKFRNAAVLAGGVFGAGVGLMHYTGMNALLIPGKIQWDEPLVTSSVLIGISLGAVALYLAAQQGGLRLRATATALLTLAVVGLHFTAMGAIDIVPDPTIPVPERLIDKSSLAIGIMAIMGIVIGTIVTAHSIDRRSQNSALAQFRHLALHDPLTGLPNRAKSSDVIARWLEEAAETNERVAVIGMDLNRFKEINDVYGHNTGDELLVVVSQRLANALAPGESIARIGGDEFLAVKKVGGGEVKAEAAAVEFASRLAATVSTPVQLADRIIAVGASCGIAIFPEDGATPADLTLRADLAMYRAKQMEANQVCRYQGTTDERTRHRSELALELQEAVNKNELELYYQPQINMEARQLVGLEALLRWRHPEKGLVEATEFVPILEETGLIIAVGQWVLETACRQAAQWPGKLSVAVNVSPVQCNRSDFVKTVEQCLRRTGLAPSRLELEVTESMLIGNIERAVQVLRRLKGLGVRIAMDDFGVGYSSLSTLLAFPFDKLKIDQSFTRSLDRNEQAASIVRAVIGLSKSLNMPVLAEGVENRRQFAFLRGEHCEQAQGFDIGRPMPEHAVARYLKRYYQVRAEDEKEDGSPGPRTAVARS